MASRKNTKGKTAEVTVGGEKRTLKYPIMALVKLEQETGLKLEDLGNEEKGSNMEKIVSFIWAGLIHEDRELTLDDVGFNLEIHEIDEVVKGMNKVLSDGKEEKENEGQAKN